MKFFAILLSFYMLALNCFPCGDSKECNEKDKQEISTSAAQSDHEHESESCTPFCSCACCASAGFYSQITPAKNISPASEPRKFYYGNDNFNSYHLHNVWQPPRLG